MRKRQVRMPTRMDYSDYRVLDYEKARKGGQLFGPEDAIIQGLLNRVDDMTPREKRRLRERLARLRKDGNQFRRRVKKLDPVMAAIRKAGAALKKGERNDH